MKISKNWLNEWIDLSAKSAQEICAALNEIGLEVDSCEQIKVADKVVVAKVLECVDHENSDHLHVCKVDAGAGEILQIVCGAPNVAEGQMVACALEGAKIGEITIKKAKLRGVESCGMLCSARELGLGEINNGIMLLDESIGELEIGKELSAYPDFNDWAIEIELTPNRGDCLSVRGVARDLSAKFDLPLKEISLAKKQEEEQIGIGRLFSIHSTELKNSALLYKAVMLSEDFQLNLKSLLRLSLIGANTKVPLNAALAYATHSTGVIFRAYDARKIEPNEEVRFPLSVNSSNNGETRICSEDKVLSVVGIWQNGDFCVDENTKVAIIEASYKAPELVANVIGQNKEQPKDELSYKSTRGSEPALSLGMSLLLNKFFDKEHVYGGSQQISHEKSSANILVNCAMLGKIIGMNIQKSDIHRILTRLNFEITTSDENGEQFYAKVPAYRHDIQNIGDVCEEIVRIYGIDNIPSAPLKFNEANRINPALIKHNNAKTLRLRAAGAGYFECVHYVFDDRAELEAFGFSPCNLKVLNPISAELSELKPTLLNSLLNSALKNLKNGKKSVKLFEYGEVFDKIGSESSKFALISCGLMSEPSLINGAKVGSVGFFDFANDLQKILGKIELEKCEEISFLSPYEQAKIIHNGVIIGFLGRLKPSVKKDLAKCYVCELDFDKIVFASKIASEYSVFPAISRDLSLLVSKDLAYKQIKECINSLKIPELKGFHPTDKYSDEKLGQNTSLTINFTFQSNEKTFTDDEINAFIQQILDELQKKLSVGLR